MKKSERINIIKQGRKGLNRWRLYANLKIADLRWKNLANQDFHEIDFYYANLTGANLKEANFREANLEGAILKGANLTSANFTGANLTRANLTGADLTKIKFKRANLTGGNFEGVDFTGINLIGVILRKANLKKANLEGANLTGANLTGADLTESNLTRANLTGADLTGAKLVGADLKRVNLEGANLEGANLHSANLSGAILIRSNFKNAKLKYCRVHGISVWDLVTNEHTEQQDIIITPSGESTIMVDNIELAQFVYLLLNNKNIRNVIDTIGKKGVLILGRFTKERKAVLDAISKKLRELGYVPMLFDFERPTQRDFTETIKTLAGLSRFIIADITNPKSTPLELQATVPDYMIPFVPICEDKEKPFSMFQDLQNKYSWVLDVLEYDSPDNLIKVMEDAIVKPALEKAEQLDIEKAKQIRKKHTKDFL